LSFIRLSGLASGVPVFVIFGIVPPSGWRLKGVSFGIFRFRSGRVLSISRAEIHIGATEIAATLTCFMGLPLSANRQHRRVSNKTRGPGPERSRVTARGVNNGKNEISRILFLRVRDFKAASGGHPAH
jgi:hypothetical protein